MAENLPSMENIGVISKDVSAKLVEMTHDERISVYISFFDHSNEVMSTMATEHSDLFAKYTSAVAGETDLVVSAGTVEATGEEFSRRYSAAEDVRALMDIFEKVEIRGNSVSPAEDDENTQETDGYTITVTDSEGVQTEYILRRGLLTNCATKETFRVPEMELSELMRLLGISND